MLNYKKALSVLFVIVLLSGCVINEIGEIINYNHQNQFRFFIKNNSTEIPEYVGIEYIKIDQLKANIFIDRHNAVSDFFQRILEKDAPIRKKGESEKTYLNRLISEIPNNTSIYQNYRGVFEHDVWNKYKLNDSIFNNKELKGLFVVTLLGSVFPNREQFEFVIMKEQKPLNSNIKLILEPSKQLMKSFNVGIAKSIGVYTKKYIIYSDKLSEKGVFELKGKYLIKKKTIYLSDSITASYRNWLEKEIWWQIHRSIDFEIDEEGNCKFSNEQRLYDESQNPSVEFKGERYLPENERPKIKEKKREWTAEDNYLNKLNYERDQMKYSY